MALKKTGDERYGVMRAAQAKERQELAKNQDKGEEAKTALRKKHVSVMLTESDHKALRHLAADAGMTVSSYIANIIGKQVSNMARKQVSN